jgi:hypothetical protein
MRCIFCKVNSDSSVSIEHIIPESLGYVDHVLPRGWVCDRCNNYISRKVEKPFLDTLYAKSTRFEMRVPSKRGRIPPGIGFHAQSRTRVALVYDEAGTICVGADEGEDETRWVSSILAGEEGTLYIPSPRSPDNDYVTARFIAKVALEVLAKQCAEINGWNDEVVEKLELDEIRNYVRRGVPNLVWPVNIRNLYDKVFLFEDGDDPSYQVLHEWIILSTQPGEFFVVVAIFGIEYSINLGGPEIEGYQQWLQANAHASPLYPFGLPNSTP